MDSPYSQCSFPESNPDASLVVVLVVVPPSEVLSEHSKPLNEAVDDKSPSMFSIHDNRYDTVPDPCVPVAMAPNLASTSEEEHSLSPHVEGEIS